MQIVLEKAVSLAEILGEFENEFKAILDAGKSLCYTCEWYQRILNDVVLAGGTVKDLQKVEDKVMDKHSLMKKGAIG